MMTAELVSELKSVIKHCSNSTQFHDYFLKEFVHEIILSPDILQLNCLVKQRGLQPDRVTMVFNEIVEILH